MSDTLSLNPLDAKGLLKTFGLVGIWVIMFAETGLMVGFFLPGDSLLFLAGIAASPVAEEIVKVKLSLGWMLLVTPLCAIAGAQVGHWLGARYGRPLFARPNSRLFKQEYVEKAEYYFNKYGPAKAVVLARFIPIVRTFLNPVAGVLRMPAREFFIWNVIGGILWTDGIILAGWALAKQITNVIPPEKIDSYIIPVTLLIVVLSAIPIMIETGRGYAERRRNRAAAGRHEAATARREPVAPRRDEV
ncbi:DedA family protein [Planosporangium sp. 12N6]|uniref:DedA family protein n=1 Tax=Planosporangium spinosum TaxID=3402278 RepID=UPI003CEE2958